MDFKKIYETQHFSSEVYLYFNDRGISLKDLNTLVEKKNFTGDLHLFDVYSKNDKINIVILDDNFPPRRGLKEEPEPENVLFIYKGEATPVQKIYEIVKQMEQENDEEMYDADDSGDPDYETHWRKLVIDQVEHNKIFVSEKID